MPQRPDGLIGGAARTTWALIPPRFRRAFVGLGAVIVLNSLLDLLVVVSLLPLTLSVAGTGMPSTQSWLAGAISALDPSSVGVPRWAALYVAVYLVFAASAVLITWLGARLSAEMKLHLSLSVMRQLMARPFPVLRRTNTAELATMVTGEVAAFVDGVLLTIFRGGNRALASLFVLAGLLAIDAVATTVIALFLVAAYSAVVRLSRPHVEGIGRQSIEVQQAESRRLWEAFASVREARALSARGYFVERYAEPARLRAAISVRRAVIEDVPRNVAEVLAIALVITAFTFFATFGGDTAAAFPLLAVYAVAVWRLVPALQGVYRDITSLRFHLPVTLRLRALFEESGPEPDAPTQEPLPFSHAIVLEDVTFRYEGATRNALDGVSLEIRQGSSIAIIGATGAGKTTLADVVAGYLVPGEGRVSVDGVTLTPELASRWRQATGYVPQEVFLLDDTVARNLAFGVPDHLVDSAAVERAARAAQIHDVIVSRLPLGYQTRLGERGTFLSGGERQRIGIARALYHDPALLIFDEATNAVDGMTEAEMLSAIRALAGPRTILVIAHRLSTVMQCEHAVLLCGGSVVVEGDPRTLREVDEAFRALFDEAPPEAASRSSPDL